MSVEPCKLNIGETSYQVSKSFIDALDDLIEKAKYASGFEDNWDNSVMELVETDLWKAISAVRNNEIVDFHTKRTEMKVRPDNKHLTDKEKLAIVSKKGIHKYMKCHKCLCVITKKEEQAHYKRKKCMKTFKQRTHNAVITIQRWARYCVHKKKYLKQQKKIAKKIVKKQNKKERHSARKIQSLWRGYVCRKNLRDTADIANRVVNTAFQLAIQNATKPKIIRGKKRTITIKRKINKKKEDKPKEKLLKDGSRRKKRDEWTMSVHTEEESGFDFTFSRWFEYEKYKTTYGYRFYFKNQADYETAKDMTMFITEWKDESLYKWNYECGWGV